jgi:hypothetical protein
MPYNLPPPEVPFSLMGPNVSRALPGPNVKRTDIHPKWKTPLTTDANPFAQLNRLGNFLAPIVRNPVDAAENALMLYGAPGAVMKLGGAVMKYAPPAIAAGLTALAPTEAEAGKASFIAKLAGNLLKQMSAKPVSRKLRDSEEWDKVSSLNSQLPKEVDKYPGLRTSAENSVLDGANIREMIEAVKKAIQYLR